jgi:hypothetical protein
MTVHKSQKQQQQAFGAWGWVNRACRVSVALFATVICLQESPVHSLHC